jgi:hypothetical protein
MLPHCLAGADRSPAERHIAARDPPALMQAIVTILPGHPEPVATMGAAEPFSGGRYARELRTQIASLLADYSG